MDIFNPSSLHHLITYLHAHPHIGGLIAFTIAFIESIALIGGLIPGSVILTAIGMLIGSGALPLTGTLIWTMAGAFVGDITSYGVGAYYNERLRQMWPFRKHPKLLTTGEDFFKAHGGKSVFIGRFVGFVRGVVALVAGLMHMSPLRFVLCTLPAAILWSVVYIVPSIVLGTLSMELPPETATKFILIVLGVVACSSLILIGIHLFFRTLARSIDHAMKYVWRSLQKHALTRWLTTLLNTFESSHHAHRQLTLLFFVFLCIALFIWMLCSMLNQAGLIYLNQPVFELLRSLRTLFIDNIMIAITLLGDKHTQLIAGALLFAWLIWKRYLWLAIHWVAVMVLSIGVTQLVKSLYFSPRPSGILHQQLTSGFPSGHTMLATALFGFLAMVLAHHLPAEKRKAVWSVAGVLILAVGFSRIYLGAHWLTDVLASLFLGLGCASFVFLFYARVGGSSVTTYQPQSCKGGKALHIFCNQYTRDSFSIKKTASAIAIIYLISWISYGATQFKQQQENYTLYWPAVTMSESEWWAKPHAETPLFVLSRFGKPRAALNVEWLGTLEEIRRVMLKQGWEEHPIHLDWRESLNRLSPDTNPQYLPVLPGLYQNQLPVLMMTKKGKDVDMLLHFTLWRSNIKLSEKYKTIFVGSVYYYDPPLKKHLLLNSPSAKHQLYEAAELVLIKDLQAQHLQFQLWKIPVDNQPAIMKSLNWDGKMTIIKSEPRPQGSVAND